MKTFIKMKLNPHLKEFWQTKSKIKILHGGRASSKTEDTAGFLIYLASKYKMRIACVRKFQSNIEQSVYSVIKKKVDNDNYFKQQYTFTQKSIKSNVGSEFVFLGWERNTEQIKGLDGIDIMWIEEGETLTEEQWAIIEPTILLRKDTAMVIVVFNPNLETDFIYKNFIANKKDGVLVKSINYNNNPFLPITALKFIENKKLEMDDAEFNHVYLGQPKEDGDDVFIKRSWLLACVDAHIKLNIDVRGGYKLGYDIADSGKDACATVLTHGIMAIDINEWRAKENELEDSHKKAYNIAIKNNASINYDCIGVGASAGGAFKRLNSQSSINIKFRSFDAGDSVNNPNSYYEPQRTNKDHFENLKAQSWQSVADRAKETYNAVINNKEYDEDNIISISSDCKYIDQLIIELSSPKKDISKRGLIKVESKEDMKKRGIPSPNIADAFIMSYTTKKSSSFFG